MAQSLVALPDDLTALSAPGATSAASLTSASASASALQVLNATIPVMKPNASKPGYNHPAAWQSVAICLRASGQRGVTVNVPPCYSNAYLPA